jgi:hypothetical protein
MRSSYEALIAAVVLGTIAINSKANIVGPYTADVNTLHLWHMDQSTVPVLDSVSSGGTNFTVLTNGATLGNASFQAARAKRRVQALSLMELAPLPAPPE